MNFSAEEFLEEVVGEELVDIEYRLLAYYVVNLNKCDAALGEYVDSAMPVYTTNIIDEWVSNWPKCNGLSLEEWGYSGDPDVTKIMRSDLYLFYREFLAQRLEVLALDPDDLEPSDIPNKYYEGCKWSDEPSESEITACDEKAKEALLKHVKGLC